MRIQFTRIVVVVGLATVVFVATICLAIHAWRPPVRILSSRLQIVSVVVIKGTNHVYFDNQLKGRVLEKLSRLGLGIKPPLKAKYGAIASKNRWIAVVYKGNYTQQELTGLKAELASSPGKVVRLYQGFCNSDPAGKNYMGAWLVDFDSGRFPSDTNTIYRLRLRLPTDGSQLAEIQLGTLRR
jgi:hypothetical protein